MSDRTRSGRAGVFSLGFGTALLLVGYVLLRAADLAPHAPPAARAPEADRAPEPLGSWRAHVQVGGADLEAWLLPLHDEPRLEAYRADALRARYALGEGYPWRLYLELAEGSADAVTVSSARVGSTLVPFAERVPAEPGPDPVRALLTAVPGRLEAGRVRPMVLWGPLPAGAASELEIACDTGTGTGRLERVEDGPVPRWYARQELPETRRRSLEAEVARLSAELDREKALRSEREAAFQEFSRKLAELPVARALGLLPEEPAPTPEDEARAAAAAHARARAEDLGRSLSVRMRLEGLRGLDLLDAGSLREGPPASIGPVLFRCLDERGLLTGSLYAERLRLEASAAAHTLTLVLEDGYEGRGGERVPFADGARRITLVDVDPEPWLEECPELFDEAPVRRVGDDGRWRLSEVRRELNRLLALDTHLGWFRLHSLGGVRGTLFLDVQVEELEPSGRLQRRFFADRMELRLEDGTAVLELEDGASVRGAEKVPFRDGRHRIVLAGIPLDAWREARLPGLSAPPEPELSAEGGSEGR